MNAIVFRIYIWYDGLGPESVILSLWQLHLES